jgi:site-specific DNA recombinase
MNNQSRINQLGRYCMYLRKSRKDIEAERHGQGETLKRHENMLFSLANRLNIVIPQNAIYKEIVSGESISSRPVIQQVLSEVENGLWDGVLTVEVERLARGDTMDQGLVAQVFKFSDTLIITPLKIYDPLNDDDEEYFEFGLFMARREYKKINQRLNNGRIASVNEGKYVGNVPPFGYDRQKLKGDKGFILVPNPLEAETVKIIFDMYANKKASYNKIAKELNQMNLKPRKVSKWGTPAIKDILSNPVYIGKIRWRARKHVKTSKKGVITVSRPRNTDINDVIITDGLHTPLVDLVTWNKTQERKKLNAPKTPHKNVLQNPVAGLVVCGKCGTLMQRRPYNYDQEPSLICTNTECDNISSKLSIIEKKIIQALEIWLGKNTIDFSTINQEAIDYIKTLEKNIKKTETELQKAEKKLENVCNYFEQGIYTKEIYFERSKIATDEIRSKRETLEQQQTLLAKAKAEQETRDEYIPRVQYVLDTYYLTDDIEDRNNMLKVILEKVVYTKTKKALKKDSDPTDFKIELYPKIPEKYS